MTDVTHILLKIDQGVNSASSELLPLVYDELRKLAVQRMAHEKPGQTLQATALVHEAFVRLVDVERVQQWKSRGHFFAAAAEAMRRILVEQARRKKSKKRGGDFQKITIGEIEADSPKASDELLALDDALIKLEIASPRKAELVKLRYFGGLTIEQAAQVLDIAPSTAISDWAYAKGWLKLEISKNLD
jgi:RNA polymerase sigma factor (TIGR02999 family)